MTEKTIKRSIRVITGKSRKSDKIWYTFEWGEESDQRKATGIYGYVKPKDAIRKNDNKELLNLLESKKNATDSLRARPSVPAVSENKN